MWQGSDNALLPSPVSAASMRHPALCARCERPWPYFMRDDFPAILHFVFLLGVQTGIVETATEI
jgi:hypothetical protein